MPELPELEILKENLTPKITGKRIVHAEVRSPAVLKTHRPAVTELSGKSFSGIERRGKHLIFFTDSPLLVVVHLMRSGRLQFCPATKPLSKYVSLRITFSTDWDLRFVEPVPKKMMAVYVVSDLSVITRLSRCGIEPLDEALSPARFASILAANRIQIKRFLTDQRFIAGIGNAYADEILFAAKLSPLKMTDALTGEEIEALARAIPAVLTWARQKIRERVGDRLLWEEPRDFLLVHRRAGSACSVCGGTIKEIRYKDHSTYYCPRCQTGGKILSDRRFSKFLK
jgi:formamidopyrimidine-DNA glycosylase